MTYRVEVRAEGGSHFTFIETDDIEIAVAAWRDALTTQDPRMQVSLCMTPWGKG